MELVTKYDTNDAKKESLMGGSKSAKGRGVHIRSRIWTGGFQIRCDRDNISSHLKYYQLSSEILEYKLILFRSGHFDHDMEKNITVIGMFLTSQHFRKHWKCGESTC